MTVTSERVALITGASVGIGRATALTLAKAGYDLVLLGRDNTRLQETVELCRETQRTVESYALDITDYAALDDAVHEVLAKTPHLAMLVNNAGLFDWASAFDADADVWEHLMNTNLNAAMRLTRLCLPAMLPGSAVVFTVSMAAKLHAPMNAAYIASKHGLAGFAGALFQDVRDKGIKVCAIFPGLVAAGPALNLGLDLATLIQPEDVAEAIRWATAAPEHLCPTEIVLQAMHNPWK